MLEPPNPEDERKIRRLLEAAAARGTPQAPSPFFLPRLRARLAAAERPHPMGLAAVQLLAAMLLLATGLSVWAVKEGEEVARARETVLARAAEQGTAASDAILAAFLQGSGEAPR